MRNCMSLVLVWRLLRLQGSEEENEEWKSTRNVFVKKKENEEWKRMGTLQGF